MIDHLNGRVLHSHRRLGVETRPGKDIIINMQQLVRFWNLIFFCLFKLQIGLYKLFPILNPVTYFLRIPLIQRSFSKKRGTENIPNYKDTSVFNDRKSGFALNQAAIHIGTILLSIELISINFYQILINKNLIDYIFDNDIYGIVAIFFLLIPESTFNYFTLFRKKKYLGYFEQFNKMPKGKLKVYCTICVVVYFLLLTLTIFSFTWLANLKII